jgi:hypothetical protein
MNDYYARLISNCPIINIEDAGIGRVQHGNDLPPENESSLALAFVSWLRYSAFVMVSPTLDSVFVLTPFYCSRSHLHSYSIY